MKGTRDVERRLRQIHWDIPPERDNRILESALSVLEETFRGGQLAGTTPAGRTAMSRARRAGRHAISRYWPAAIALAGSFVLVVGLLVAVSLKESRTTSKAHAEGTLFPWADIDTSPVLPASAGQSLGWLPLSVRVGRASAIVRCEMKGLIETALICEVKRVIYGRIPGRLLHVEGRVEIARLTLRSTLGREPTREEIEEKALEGFKASRDFILFVGQMEKTDKAIVCRHIGASYHVPPKRPLDKVEKDIVEVIRTGAHLTPPSLSPADLGVYIRSSERIVRAKLTKVGDRTAEWEVAGVLYVAPKGYKPGLSPAPSKGATAQASPWFAQEAAKLEGTTIAVALDPWRLRAESVVNYEAAQDLKTPATEELVQKEFARLVAAELDVSREAILFLRAIERANADVQYKLVAILYDDAEKAIDECEEIIIEAIQKADLRIHHL